MAEVRRMRRGLVQESPTPIPITSKEFKQDAAALRKKRAAIGKTRQVFTKAVKETHRAFMAQIETELTVLKGIHKSTVKQVFQSKEYKDAISSKLSYHKSLRSMANKYNITEEQIINLVYKQPTRDYFRTIYRHSVFNWRIKRLFRIHM